MAEAALFPQAIIGMLPAEEGIAPLAAVVRALSGFNREQLGSAIEVMIAMLDAADPDPEAEEIPVEDAQLTYDVPPAEDPTDADLEETDCEDAFWLSPAARANGSGPGCTVSDPDTGVEDDPLGIDPEEDKGIEDEPELDEAENGLTPDWGIDQSRSLPAALVLDSDRANMVEHRRRIRMTRCDKFERWGRTCYRIRDTLPGCDLPV